MRHHLVLSLALTGLGLVAAPQAQATYPGKNGKIAFAPQYFMAPNSIGTIEGERVRGAISTGPVEGPANIAWSSDGARLAFDGPAITLGSGRALYIMNADGTGLRQVGRGDQRRYSPAFSPDGTKLAFVQDNGPGAGSGDIYSISTSGAGLTRLTTTSTWDSSPEFSPDGTRIAYSCMSGGRRHVCQMPRTGGSRTVTTAGLQLADISPGPSWSPDGAALAFSAKRPGSELFEIFRISRSGGSAHRFPAVDVGRPTWSPDGTRIAYDIYASGGDFAIDSASALDGEGAVELISTDDLFNVDASGWQPLP